SALDRDDDPRCDARRLGRLDPRALERQAGRCPVALPPGVMTNVAVAELEQPVGHLDRALAFRALAVDDDLRVAVGDAPARAVVDPSGRQIDRTGEVRGRKRHRRECVDEDERVAVLDLVAQAFARDGLRRAAHSRKSASWNSLELSTTIRSGLAGALPLRLPTHGQGGGVGRTYKQGEDKLEMSNVLRAIVAACAVALLVLPGAMGAANGSGQASNDVKQVSDDIKNKLRDKQDALRGQGLQMKLAGKVSGKIARVAKGQYVELAREGEDTIWTVLAEFGTQQATHNHGVVISHGGAPGPLHNQIPQPNRADDNTTIW